MWMQRYSKDSRRGIESKSHTGIASQAHMKATLQIILVLKKYEQSRFAKLRKIRKKELEAVGLALAENS